MQTPIDATSTPAWGKLSDLKSHFVDGPHKLRRLFDVDSQRAERYTLDVADLHVDVSKNLLTDEIRDALLELAEQTHVTERRDAMYAGEHINVTEDRAVLHTALRRPATDSLVVDGQDAVADVHEVLDKIYAFAGKVRSGEWRGVTGKPIRTVINVGIGGSDLGPVMAYEALKPYVKEGLECRFISNIDPTDAAVKTADLDPETTLVIIASKTFTTLETLTNARCVRAWLLDGLVAAGAIEDTEEARRGAVAKHFVAVSTALDKVEEFGIDPVNAFGFWSWVGGRYSVDSAVGTSLAVAIGPKGFEDFLAGFRAVDEHFATAAPEQNVPLLMGMLNIWYVNFWKAHSHAVLPYAQYLHRFPAYLQQLTMESNGKSVRHGGERVTYDTGEVFWGEPGTNGQHAFYQLIHQGTNVIPAEFLVAANGHEADLRNHHELLLANCLAQSEALMLGRDLATALGTVANPALAPHKVFAGNRPSTTLVYARLDPATLGKIIALYEHRVFVEGAIWGLNSFDQWGVELGKELATALLPLVQAGQGHESKDGSTAGLLTAVTALREA